MKKDENNEGQPRKQARDLNQNIVLFETVEEAWFWFVLAQQAKVEGARYTAGLSLTPRPCEPSDILKILNNLYRNRLLLWDHCLVLRHYGRRQLAPDPSRVKEVRAHKLWCEAMKRLEPVLIRKGIMNERNIFASSEWAKDVVVHSDLLSDGVVQ